MIIKNKLFFKGLNELRAIAALGVVIHHIEQFKGMNGLRVSNANLSFLIHNLGRASVHLFFVLSGFLITFLLLQEKNNNNGRINILKFYFRRIFRIWPLYYLIMLISFIVIPLLSNFQIFEHNTSLLSFINDPDSSSLKTIVLYIIFLPQFANFVVGASQSWSIGLEEQFYLLMPLALSIFNRRIFFALVLILSVIYFSLTIEVNKMFSVSSFVVHVFKFLKYFNFQFLLIGVIGGYLYFFNLVKIASFTKSKIIYISLIFLTLFLSFIMVFEYRLNHFILGILFLLLILFTINDTNQLVLKNKKLSYLGKISYGIYMYHVFVLFLIFPWANKYFLEKTGDDIVYNLFLYVTSFLFTILLSILSYEFLESKFIRIKDLKFKAQ